MALKLGLEKNSNDNVRMNQAFIRLSPPFTLCGPRIVVWCPVAKRKWA